jgi:hypothetical protein
MKSCHTGITAGMFFHFNYFCKFTRVVSHHHRRHPDRQPRRCDRAQPGQGSTGRIGQHLLRKEISVEEEAVKSWIKSRAVWGGIVAAGSGVAGLLGHAVDQDAQNAVADGAQHIATNAVNIYTSVVAIMGGVAAIWGRIRAKQPIGGK